MAEYTTRGQVINRYKKGTEACELQVRLLTSKKERSKPKRTFFFNEPSLSTMRMTTVTQDLTTTMDLSTDDPSIIDRLESFLYTPMGVGTLAAVAVVITSLIWLVGCCIYCCCRRRRSSEEGGVTVANRDLMFLDIGPTELVHNGTMSSGYNTGPQPYTTSNSYNNPMARNGSTAMLHTSLDSVISVDRY